MLGHQAIVIIFVLFKACLEVQEGKVSTLAHLNELSLDECERFLLVKVPISIIIKVVPNVLNTVADYFMDRNLLDSIILAIWSLFV